MRPRVHVICEDPAVTARLGEAVTTAGGDVADTPADATVIVMDTAAPGAEARLMEALRALTGHTSPGIRREELLAVAVESAGDVVEITDADHNYEYVNPAFERTLGYSADEVVGRPAGRLLRSQLQDDAFFRSLYETIDAGESWSGIMLAKTRDGRVVQFETAISPVRAGDGTVRHHVAVKRDVTERIAAEAELRAMNEAVSHARDAALEASRTKSQFLGNMSHELRTPLNAIMGYTELLIENAEDRQDAEALTDLGRILESSRHLLSLVDGVLDLARLEAGETALEAGPCDLRAMISELIATVQPMAFERGNEFVLQYGLGYQDVVTDVPKVRQLVSNLLINADKFTDRGPILVRVLEAETPAEATGEFFAIAISDTGIGMTAEEANRVFDPFVQADDSATRTHGGSGLGLSISRRYCQIMGGSIAVETVPGQGSTFTVVLPRRLSRPGRS